MSKGHRDRSHSFESEIMNGVLSSLRRREKERSKGREGEILHEARVKLRVLRLQRRILLFILPPSNTSD